MPVISITGGTPAIAIKTADAISDMTARSSSFNNLLSAVGQRYQFVHVYIGNGANAGFLGNASSGQDASDPNTFNVYIDTSRH